jgi:hypothetical protein
MSNVLIDIKTISYLIYRFKKRIKMLTFFPNKKEKFLKKIKFITSTNNKNAFEHKMK